MKCFNFTMVLVAASLISGCATWSTTSVDNDSDQGKSPTQTASKSKTPIGNIIITEADITERPYESLGDITATVNKTTIFHPDPTPALVAEKLREKAYELGADAVILVRYGTVGVSLISWGSLDGKGRAVRFTK
jgi:hypothetical protein